MITTVLVSVVGSLLTAAILSLIAMVKNLNDSVIRLDERVKIMNDKQTKNDHDQISTSEKITEMNERLIRVEEFIKNGK